MGNGVLAPSKFLAAPRRLSPMEKQIHGGVRLDHWWRRAIWDRFFLITFLTAAFE